MSDIEDEACLSFPNMYGPVERPLYIQVKYQNLSGDFEEKIFKNFEARLFQHEYDHLQGILFTDHLSRLTLERAKKKKNKREKQYARAREQFIQIAREHYRNNPKLPNEGTVQETDTVSQD